MENKLALIPISEIKEMAVAAYKSGLFQLPSQEATLTLMLLCQAEGLHPIQALRQYHIIKGRPAMRADAMQAAFTNAGGKIEWRERSDKKASAIFSHAQGGSLEVTWTIEQARAAGLVRTDRNGDPGMWHKYPRAMLAARVVSEGCRAVLPAVVCGLYTPEEVSDFEEPAATKRTSKAKASPAPSNGTIVDAEIVPAVTEKPQDKPQTLAEKCGFNNAVPVEPEVSPEQPPATETKEPLKAFWCDSCHRIANAYSRPGTCKCGSNVWYEAANMEAAQEAITRKINKTSQPAPAPAPAPAAPAAPTTAESAGDIAAEVKQVRELAQKYGCKTVKDFSELMQIIIGRPVANATSLGSEERAQAFTWLNAALNETKEQEAA